MPPSENNIWLVLLLAVPLAGALIAAFVPEAVSRLWALLVSIVTLAVAIVLGCVLIHANALNEVVHFRDGEITAMGVSFSLFVDNISIWLILLTALLTPVGILYSFGSIKQRQREYYAWMLALLVVMLGVFVARDLLLFYICFELSLVPMFFIIGIWGGSERRYAAAKFFLFTFAGGVLTLATVVFLGMRTGTFDIPTVVAYAQHDLSLTARWWVVLGLLAGFAVKTPLFPVHTWLPLAHTEAPTAGSVILAGVLLKLGTYGLLRLMVPIGLVSAAGGTVFPGLVKVIAIICIIGVIYGALVSWVQVDIKRLVAYSSVSHLGFCVLGLMALNTIGVQGSILYMVNHGLSTGAMFLVIGMIYDRYHTRDMNHLSGLARKMPILAFFFVFFVLSSIGLPGLNGFVSEFLTILGAFTSNVLGSPVYAVVAALGIILGALYMLHMTARVIFGPLKVPDVDSHGHAEPQGGSHAHAEEKNDIGLREICVLTPLALLVVFLGVCPSLVLNPMLREVEQLRSPVAVIAPPPSPTITAALGNRQLVARASNH